jgi:hypothetical protein
MIRVPNSRRIWILEDIFLAEKMFSLDRVAAGGEGPARDH